MTCRAAAAGLVGCEGSGVSEDLNPRRICRSPIQGKAAHTVCHCSSRRGLPYRFSAPIGIDLDRHGIDMASKSKAGQRVATHACVGAPSSALHFFAFNSRTLVAAATFFSRCTSRPTFRVTSGMAAKTRWRECLLQVRTPRADRSTEVHKELARISDAFVGWRYINVRFGRQYDLNTGSFEHPDAR